MTDEMWLLLQNSAPWLIGGVCLVLFLLLFHRPLCFLWKMLVRALFGLGALALWSPIGKLLGITLGVNLWNGLILGALGIPGFGLLLMLHWMVLS
jgi:inhibitor of the pro-sigma K processing machinery